MTSNSTYKRTIYIFTENCWGKHKYDTFLLKLTPKLGDPSIFLLFVPILRKILRLSTKKNIIPHISTFQKFFVLLQCVSFICSVIQFILYSTTYSDMYKLKCTWLFLCSWSRESSLINCIICLSILNRLVNFIPPMIHSRRAIVAHSQYISFYESYVNTQQDNHFLLQ